MSPALMQRIALVVTLLDKAKAGLLKAIGEGKTLEKFFSYDDDEMSDRIGELLEKETWETNELLELAAIFLIEYLKDGYYNDSEGD